MKKLWFVALLTLVLGIWMSASGGFDTAKGAIKQDGVFYLVCHDATGKVKWTDIAHNNLADEGEQWLLDTFLRGAAGPATFYLRVWNDTPAETDAISNLSGEPSGNGYSAKEVERSDTGWPTLAIDSGDYQAVSKSVTWTASGGSIGPVTYITLCTSSDASGKLISYAALSATRTLAAGDSLTATYRIKQQ